MIKRTTAIAALSILFGATAAHAVDFVFTVPVEVRALPPEAREVTVACYVHGAGGVQLGSARRSRPLTDHGFNGEVRVEVTRLPGERRRAEAWFCRLLVQVTLGDRRLAYAARSGSRMLHAGELRDEPVPAPNIEPRAGAPVVLEVIGRF